MGVLLSEVELKEIRALSLEGVGTPHGKAAAMNRARLALLNHISALQFAYERAANERDTQNRRIEELQDALRDAHRTILRMKEEQEQ